MKWLKDYFDMSRKEESGFIILISLIIILFALQFIWIYILPGRNLNTSVSNQISSGPVFKNDNIIIKPDSSNTENAGLFNFDPNSVDILTLEKLGLHKNVISHIIHYRQKGGYFYKIEDFEKIYDLTQEDFERLKPYILINHTAKKIEIIHIDLNKADSMQLLTVKGIGPVFSSRILVMRKRLGCFVNKNQLLDIYGIDREKYDFIKNQVYITKIEPIKININTANIDTLKRNPYIRYKLASVIVNFRKANGPFLTLEDLKKIIAIDDKTYLKLLPYLTVK